MIAFNSARLPAYFCTRSARFFSRFISESFAMATSVSEREFKCGEKRFGFVVGLRGCGDTDVHATQRINLVVLDLGEDDLLFHTDVVVATAVERTTGHATEVAHAGQRNRDQAVQEFVHAGAAQGHHATDRIAFADLETRDSLASLGHHW